jgi:hypothetical protein
MGTLPGQAASATHDNAAIVPLKPPSNAVLRCVDPENLCWFPHDKHTWLCSTRKERLSECGYTKPLARRILGFLRQPEKPTGLFFRSKGADWNDPIRPHTWCNPKNLGLSLGVAPVSGDTRLWCHRTRAPAPLFRRRKNRLG